MDDTKVLDTISIDDIALPILKVVEVPKEEWKEISELNEEYIDVISEIAYRIYEKQMFFKGKIKYKKQSDENKLISEINLFKTEPISADLSGTNTNYGEVFSINREGYVIDNTYLKNYDENREINLDLFCLNV